MDATNIRKEVNLYTEQSMLSERLSTKRTGDAGTEITADAHEELEPYQTLAPN
jgi:hypothetical protein